MNRLKAKYVLVGNEYIQNLNRKKNERVYKFEDYSGYHNRKRIYPHELLSEQEIRNYFANPEELLIWNGCYRAISIEATALKKRPVKRLDFPYLKYILCTNMTFEHYDFCRYHIKAAIKDLRVTSGFNFGKGSYDDAISKVWKKERKKMSANDLIIEKEVCDLKNKG
jgi:hypothetical protein